uniref:uncharacterized protein LOC117268863 isoform X2 n=1 Tax=Epinephelus lanceolatus TaxID=310571 RepID=UPI001445900B|nr:uncharacterized protein LOC117268863 isoform X2 [Epinephelus lanceolatus]
MTAWKHARLCLFVILSLINLSKEGCEDYFTVERMKKYLDHTVYLIETGELKDTLECTVERQCIAGHEPYCLWLDHCYDRKDVPKTETEKCKGNPSVGISHYHFGCLVSYYTLSEPVEGCKNYERVCELHKERQPVTNNSKIVHEAGNDNTNTDPLKIFLGISVIFNVIAVLGGLYMRRRWTQDSKQWGNMLVLESNGYPTEVPLATEPRSETPLSSANREEENIHLMTPQNCQSIITHSADRDSHCCAAGEEKHL